MGVNTVYQYHPQNGRLQTITTSSPAINALNGSQYLLILAYDYTDGGNIKSITDPNQPVKTAPGVAVTYAYAGTKPHFVTSTTSYWATGTIVWTYEPEANPVKHGLTTAPSIWRYSSFHRFVKEGTYHLDWGAKDAIMFNGAIRRE